jgi:hypothetical protein
MSRTVAVLDARLRAALEDRLPDWLEALVELAPKVGIAVIDDDPLDCERKL